MSQQVKREVTWGEGIVVAAFKQPLGLKGAVDRIQGTVGAHIGSRNTFAKLMRVESPADLSERDRFRAWLLLTALGEDAPEWGIENEVVPSGYDLVLLKYGIRDSNPEPADSEHDADLSAVVALLSDAPSFRLFGDPRPADAPAPEPRKTSATVTQLIGARRRNEPTASRLGFTAPDVLAVVIPFARTEQSA